ncbi:helix-turn-helix domain-containing protein [Streptomyces bohaiensis]|uniref:Helix-turn-helix domain-containing protein n=1 Tax=Streptomyces bohaiensis TaxID=1431344 RepID=A0ABX1C8P1_9ACTN|nr:pyridoxamine 5'-phosphate oxidase family protein [Streptomyces bohaiensis]NJQ15509.1 helix-turn-helix domain-containing protein [Streptomyces bohaiensis]
MSEPHESMPSASGRTPPGDLGRRITARRLALGLSREEVADRARTTTGYIAYLEENPAPSPGLGVVLRVAHALETTGAALHGAAAGPPPGIGRAALRARLVAMDEEESRNHLSGHGVGRVAVESPDGLLIIPVNYTVIAGDIVFRTADRSALSAVAGTDTTFEVDQVDEAMSSGWSVLVHGPAREVTDDDEIAALDRESFSKPWAGGQRDRWVALTPSRISGRRIATG